MRAWGMVCATLALGSCSVLQPEETGLNPGGEEIEVTTSAAPMYQAKDITNTEVTTNLAAPQKDEGLGVTWTLQGVYSDTYRGSVLTVLLHNNNDMPLPVDAVKDPILEVSDGMGGWKRVELLPYDPELNADVLPPGLDVPLGAGASTNLQYRVDSTVGGLWKARLTMGNITWVGNLNL